MVVPLLGSSSAALLVAALLLVAICMFITDLFLTSDYLSIVAYAAISGAGVIAFDPETWIGGTASFLGLWLGLIVAHFVVVQTYIIPLVHRAIAPHRRRDGASAVVGRTGVIVKHSDSTAVRVGDELWPLARPGDQEPGTHVRVIAFEKGAVVVARYASQSGD